MLAASIAVPLLRLAEALDSTPEAVRAIVRAAEAHGLAELQDRDGEELAVLPGYAAGRLALDVDDQGNWFQGRPTFTPPPARRKPREIPRDPGKGFDRADYRNPPPLAQLEAAEARAAAARVDRVAAVRGWLEAWAEAGGSARA